MAVSQMKRLWAVSPCDGADELTEKLMWLSCVEIEQSDGDTVDCADELSRLRSLADSFRAARTFLSPYMQKSRGLFAPRQQIQRSVVGCGFLESKGFIEAKAAVDEANEVAQKLQSASAEGVTLNDRIASLSPWLDCDVPLIGVKTKYTVTVTGAFAPGVDVEKTIAAASLDYAVSAEIVADDSSGTYAVVTAHKADAEDAFRYLSQNGFTRTPPDSAVSSTASAADREARTQLVRLAAVSEDLKGRAAELAFMIPDIECYSDAIKTAVCRIEGKRRLEKTKRTVILKGWVPAKAESAVADELDKLECAYEFIEPSDGEEPPVLLDNKAPASFFEPVVAMYSMPKYGTFDPTAIMSVFYTVIFGLMLADVGYGLLLTGACFLGMKLLKPTGSMKKFMQMFALCGISCAVMGVVFGGYFGDMPQAIAQNWFGVTDFPDISLWFNPLNDPMLYLIVSLGIGVIHLVTALCIKFYIMCRAGRPLDAVFDVGSWLILFAGIGVVFIFKITGIVMIASGVLMLVATQGRAEKNPVMKLLKGILSLYDIVSYVSDLLSYSRILSLGLASAVIASVVNILGTMSGPSFLSVIFMLVIFAAGHVLNLVINALGSFVHTSRLQYIEFFGKFYEDGGRVFAPLEPAADYISLV